MINCLKKCICLFLLCAISFTVSAQIGLPGKAKDLIKDKKTDKPNTEKASEQPKPTTARTKSEKPNAALEKSGAESPSESREEQSPAATARRSGTTDRSGGARGSTVELDFNSQPFAPSIAWKSLLSSGVWYFNPTTGEMKLNSILVSFLPKKKMDGTEAGYASYDNDEPMLRMEVHNTATNQLDGTHYYEAKEATLPFYEMTILEGSPYLSRIALTEGTYELRFFAGTKHFYSYPFQVVKQTNPDPYAPAHDFYFLRGPWEKWGRVEFGPDGHFIFNFYLNYETTTIPNQSRWDINKPCKYLVKLYRDGKMVAVHQMQHVENQFMEGDLQLTNGKWKKFDVTFHQYPPAAKGNGAGSRPFFMKNDMKDGAYKVEVWLKDEAGAETTHRYEFTVKGGVVVSAPEADRAQNANPLQFLEQGPGQFYVKKL
ncbi:MAG: hypothetical protein JNJ57_17690 [Saprospiraceae bacterium]|nr:hypothetical protein [Saprospiraceae bacterium]